MGTDKLKAGICMGKIGRPGFEVCAPIIIVLVGLYLFWAMIDSDLVMVIVVYLCVPVMTWAVWHLFAARATSMISHVAKGKVKDQKEVWFVAEKQSSDWTARKLLKMAIFPVALIFGVSGTVSGIFGEIFYYFTGLAGLLLIFSVFSVFIIPPKWILEESNIRRVNRYDSTVIPLAQHFLIDTLVGLGVLLSFLNYIKLDWRTLTYSLLVIYPMGVLLTLLYTRFSLEKNVDKLIQEFEKEGLLVELGTKASSQKPIGFLATEQLLTHACTRFCPYCGAETPKEVPFCPTCGRRLPPR